MIGSKIVMTVIVSAALSLASGLTPAEARWGGARHSGWSNAAIAAGIGAGLAWAAAAASRLAGRTTRGTATTPTAMVATDIGAAASAPGPIADRGWIRAFKGRNGEAEHFRVLGGAVRIGAAGSQCLSGHATLE
jgi:hypothetical protein